MFTRLVQFSSRQAFAKSNVVTDTLLSIFRISLYVAYMDFAYLRTLEFPANA